MPDMHCPRCGEPSDVSHVRHSATAPMPTRTDGDRVDVAVDPAGPGWHTTQAVAKVKQLAEERLPDDMPAQLREATLAAIVAEANVESILLSPIRPIPDSVYEPAAQAADTAAEAWRRQMYDSGLTYGCDCCLLEPERRTDRLDDLERAVFDSCWDGDPAILFDRV